MIKLGRSLAHLLFSPGFCVRANVYHHHHHLDAEAAPFHIFLPFFIFFTFLLLKVIKTSSKRYVVAEDQEAML